MTPAEHKAFTACLCGKCGGLTKVPDVALPAQFLRWCLCVFEETGVDIEEIGEEKPREPIGFRKSTKKGSG